ncbi:MAG: energy transducer TonB [Gammaproteobacteria bacterium]|nr:energy transducer TonB [Gammaproteobacteria bacterium]
MTPGTRSLPLFLVLSLTAHAVLLAAWRADSTREPREYGASTLGEGTLTVALNTRQQPTAHAPDPLPRRESAVVHDQPVATVRQSSDTLTVTNKKTTLLESRDAQSSQAVRNYLLGKVRTELARYFQYPALARERGWEGQVILGFSLQADGHLEKIHIARSSGYHVLDESARAALGRISTIADAGQWLDGRAIDMQLPVIYRLLDR